MSAIYILLLASLAIAVVFVVVFAWAVRSGQYDDTVTPAMRILTDDDQTSAKTIQSNRGGENKEP
jgi:cbb3-type cytochrome oxidase maturation protein